MQTSLAPVQPETRFMLLIIQPYFSFSQGVINTSFDPSPTGFTISSTGYVKYYNFNGILTKTISSYGFALPQISQGVVDNNDIWIADLKSGLIRGENMDTFTALTLPGPISNDAFNITSLNGKTVICGGGTDISWNNIGNPSPFQFMKITPGHGYHRERFLIL